MIKIRPLRARWFSYKMGAPEVHDEYQQLTTAIYTLWYNNQLTLGERNKDLDAINNIYKECIESKGECTHD